GEGPGIGPAGLVPRDEATDVRDQPLGLVARCDRAVRLDGYVVPGRDDLAGQALLLVPGGRDVGIRAIEDRQGLPCPIAAGLDRRLDLAPLRVPPRQVTAQRAVRGIAGTEQHRQDRCAETIRTVRAEPRPRNPAESGQYRGRMVYLELLMPR